MSTPIQLAIQHLPRTRRRRRIRSAQFPRNVERQYVAAQRALVSQLTSLIDELLIPRLPELARMAGARVDSMRLDQSPWRALLNQILGDARARWAKAEALARENARKAAADVSLHNREQIRRQMRSAVGFDLFYDDPDLQDLMEQFEQTNVSNIVTIGQTAFPTIERIVSDGFRSGVRATSIADNLVKALGVIQSKAEFWARDQIGSLNGQLTRSRQKAIGIEEYIWRTSRDERVRATHRQLEGTKHSWDDPPAVGARQVHPGEDYNCRCTPDPVIPGEENEQTSPADVPLPKAKKGRRGRKIAAQPSAVRLIPATAEAKTVRLPRTGRAVSLSADQSRRSAVAKTLDTKVETRAAATTSQRLDRLLWNWVHGSARKTSVELKAAAIREFKLRGTAYNPRNFRVENADINRSAKDLRALYNATQKHLGEKGRQSITVYRGVRSNVAQRGAVESWSTSEATAKKFAGPGGKVLTETVPTERVLAIRNGPHWLDGTWGNQNEVIILY